MTALLAALFRIISDNNANAHTPAASLHRHRQPVPHQRQRQRQPLHSNARLLPHPMQSGDTVWVEMHYLDQYLQA
jgi:hypothetical protein